MWLVNHGGEREIIMKYLGAAVSDTGISKRTNQDGVCIKIADTEQHGQIAMCVLCDGMGGLKKGELASATVIRAFIEWFEQQLPWKISGGIWDGLSADWERLVKACNFRILEYGRKEGITLGTTVSAILLMEGHYLIAHVGDSRVYKIAGTVEQLTEDHSFVAREIKRGNMTEEEAENHPQRNVLIQCVGASGIVTPDILHGRTEKGDVYMLCSDGFRHKLSTEEIYEEFRAENIGSAEIMEDKERYLINRVKTRNERDNITVALMKCEE